MKLEERIQVFKTIFNNQFFNWRNKSNYKYWDMFVIGVNSIHRIDSSKVFYIDEFGYIDVNDKEIERVKEQIIKGLKLNSHIAFNPEIKFIER